MVKKTTPRSFRHLWSVLCRSASVDKESNSLSLFNVLEEITINKAEDLKRGKETIGAEEQAFIIPIEFVIVTFLERLDDKDQGSMTKEAQVEIVDPSSRSILKREFEINFRQGFKRLRHLFKMNGLKITTAGTYKFYISIRESKEPPFELVAEIPVDVKIGILLSKKVFLKSDGYITKQP